MKKRNFIGKLLGQDDSETMPSAVTFERRPPAMTSEQQPKAPSFPSRSGSRAEREGKGGVTVARDLTPALESREDLKGLLSNLPPATSAKLNELNRARSDLAQMEQELSNSQRMFKAASDRMGELNRFLSHSEVNISTLERLEPENERLNVTITELRSDLTREKALSSETEARAIAIESKYLEAQKANEQYRQDALTLKESIRSLKQTIDAKNKEINELIHDLEETKDSLDIERDNAALLAEKNNRMMSEMSSVSRKNMELEKRVEEIHASNKRNAKERDSAAMELKTLRLEYTSLRDASIDKSARLEALQNELMIKERNFDENLKYRENEVFGLQSTMEDLKVQLRIKEEVSVRSDRELTDTKQMMADETKRRRRLENDLTEMQKQLEQNREALLLSRQNFDDLNRRLVDAQSELRAVKIVNQQQSIKLEQYSAVGGVVVDFKKEAGQISRRRKAAEPEAPAEKPSASDTSDDDLKTG